MTSRLQGGRAGLAILTVAGLVLSLFALFAGSPAQANHVLPNDTVPQSSAANQAPFWEAYLDDVRGITTASCSKINDSGDDAFVMPAEPAGEDWVLLVVKQATTNYVYYDPIAGHPYPSVGDQAPGYSHLIVCSAPEPPVDTTDPPVDTTEPPVDTTDPPVDTTEPPVDTTQPPVDTTEPPVDTTQPPVDTTEPPVDTTIAPTTTVEVAGTSITAAPSTTVAVSVTEETLPFTGLENGTTGLFAMLLVALGLMALAGARRFGEDES